MMMRILALSEEDVSDSLVNKVIHWITGVDHQTIQELHRLGSLSSKLARHDNLASLRPTLHYESQDTIASPEIKPCHPLLYIWQIKIHIALRKLYNY